MSVEVPYKKFFAGKRITLMGLGLLGRGVGDARFLASLGTELIVTDLKSETELAASLSGLKQFSNITYHLGGHRLEDFKDRDMIIKAAGVPLDSIYIAEAHKNSVPVYMSTALFAKFAGEAGAIVVGVTGTRGKSTVTHLIAHSLQHAGKKVLLGGNVRGISTLAELPAVSPDTIAVLELDSWQLQGFGDSKISPNVAVFTNLMPDHLNYYHGDMEAYFWDKANIFIHQKRGDTLIVSGGVLSQVQKAMPPVAPVVPPPLPHDWKLRLIGEHNKENAALVAFAVRMLGLSDNEIRTGLESFEPVEGRLQKIAEINDVAIYNDNNATTPDATVAAIAAVLPKKPVLIIGGADKGLPLEILANIIPGAVIAVIYLKGTGTDKLKSILDPLLDVKKIPRLESDSMTDAVVHAVKFASRDGAVLFSPAFASFGLFKNEYDRNDQFLAAVKNCKW